MSFYRWIRLIIEKYILAYPRLQEFAAINLAGIVKNHFSTLQIAGCLQWVSVAVLGRNLCQQDCVGSTIFDVGGEVVYSLVPSSILQMVVEPPCKDFQ